MQEGTVLRERYRQERLLGRGGMADVYLAFDLQRQVEVAIKVLREDLAEDPEFVRRFQREAEALARLDHPYIVRFYSFERQGTVAFIVMDYIPGKTLRGRLAETSAPLDLAELTRILRQIGTALNYSHNLGYVHRDIKPGNIMLREDGTALLSDFGIAHVAEGTTMTMGPLGTPAYMSPEQILGRPVGPTTDIYSLGVVLYESVTGRRPFVGESGTGTGTTDRVRDEHLHAMAPDPRLFNPSLPPAAANVILRALAKDPAQRYPDLMSMVREWEESLGLQHVSMSPGQSQVSMPRTPTLSRPITGGPTAYPTGWRPAATGMSTSAGPTVVGAPGYPSQPSYQGAQAPRAGGKRRGWLVWAVGGIAALVLVGALLCVLGLANRGGTATPGATALALDITATVEPTASDEPAKEPSPTPEEAGLASTPVLSAGELFSINSDRGWTTDSGSIAIVGEVTNISGHTIDRMVDVVAALTDKNGSAIKGDFRAFVDRPIIADGEKSSFYLLFGESDLGGAKATDVDQYNLSFELSEAAAPDVEMRVDSSEAAPDGDGMSITGRATNNTDMEFVALSLYGTVYDKDNKVLNVLFDLVKLDQPLGPGASTDFTVSASDHCQGAESYYIFVTGWTQDVWDQTH